MPTIKHRRASKAHWVETNPVLAAGEIALELGATVETHRVKIGDGLSNWNQLKYFLNESDADFDVGRLSEESLDDRYLDPKTGRLSEQELDERYYDPATGRLSEESLDGQYASTSGGFNFAGPFSSLANITTGEGFVMKPASDTRQGVFGWQHASAAGYIIHFESREGGAAPGAMIGIGLDRKAPDGVGLGVAGILISNKVGSQGIVLSNGVANDNVNGFGMYATQSSTVAPLIALHSRVDSAAPLLQLKVESGTAQAGQVLARFITGGNHLAGDISAFDGTLRWIDQANFRDSTFNTTLTVRNGIAATNPAKIVVTDPATAAGIIELQVDLANKSNPGISFYRSTGGATNWPRRIIVESQVMKFQGSPAASKGSETWNTLIGFTDTTLGFFGVTPVGQQSVGTAATDAATTMALANSLRAALIAIGQCKV